MFSRLTALLLTLFLTTFSASIAWAWGGSNHAYVARKSHTGRYWAKYNLRLGSNAPDFFWYLQYRGLVDAETAYLLHGVTEEPGVSPETTWFYGIALRNLPPGDRGLAKFVEGLRTHLYADIRAHDRADGYVEGAGRWVDVLRDRTGEEDRESLHLALEFAVDALLVRDYPLQLSDLLSTGRQAWFMERCVLDAFEELGLIADFDVSREFTDYMALIRTLEKAALIYAPYLPGGAVQRRAPASLLSELRRAALPLSQEAQARFSDVIRILLTHPRDIFNTLTAEGMHWKRDALPDVIDFCR